MVCRLRMTDGRPIGFRSLLFGCCSCLVVPAASPVGLRVIIIMRVVRGREYTEQLLRSKLLLLLLSNPQGYARDIESACAGNHSCVAIVRRPPDDRSRVVVLTGHSVTTTSLLLRLQWRLSLAYEATPMGEHPRRAVVGCRTGGSACHWLCSSIKTSRAYACKEKNSARDKLDPGTRPSVGSV